MVPGSLFNRCKPTEEEQIRIGADTGAQAPTFEIVTAIGARQKYALELIQEIER